LAGTAESGSIVNTTTRKNTVTPTTIAGHKAPGSGTDTLTMINSAIHPMMTP
jgi:hypothetical protein